MSVLKWVGGKSAIAPFILEQIGPEPIDHYFEPFLGGGAVFQAIAPQIVGTATLSDVNEDLMNVYKCVVYGTEALITELERLQPYCTEDDYYRIRNQYNTEGRVSNLAYDVVRAAQFIYLNKRGFRGMYRVSKSGAFNVPYGNYATDKFYDVDDIQTLRDTLRKPHVTELTAEPFQDVFRRLHHPTFGYPPRRRVVYADPPYAPLSKTANFTAYTPGKFGIEDHKALVSLLRSLAEIGYECFLSSSTAPEVRELYLSTSAVNVYVHEIDHKHAINPYEKGARKITGELLVRFEKGLR